MEVEADCYTGDREALEQDARDELLRRRGGELGIEGQHDRSVKTRSRKEPQFRTLIGETEQRFIRSK